MPCKWWLQTILGQETQQQVLNHSGIQFYLLIFLLSPLYGSTQKMKLKLVFWFCFFFYHVCYTTTRKPAKSLSLPTGSILWVQILSNDLGQKVLSYQQNNISFEKSSKWAKGSAQFSKKTSVYRGFTELIESYLTFLHNVLTHHLS